MFSKSSKYAIRAVLYLAIHEQGNKKIGVKEIAEALGVPGPFLAKILQELARAQLISSSKGPNGGFYLNEHNKQTNLKQIIECLDGQDFFSTCVLHSTQCNAEMPCAFHQKANLYRSDLVALLTAQTVGECAQKIQLAQLPF